MKVEIGESLVRTWVRHCKGCQLAELNWKPSPIWPAEVTIEHKEWYAEGASQFPQNVLKKTASISQFLGQAEIDVLGIRFAEGNVEKVIAADIAFHTHGLTYGPTAETAARVTKKLFRTALTLDLHFPNIPAEIIFLSPKVNPATLPSVLEAASTMQSFFEKRCGHFQFSTIVNDEFKKIVLDKVTPLQSKVSDTSELYLRAIQLIGLFENYKPNIPTAPSVSNNKSSKISKTLPIEIIPSDPNEFKKLLIERGAVKYEHYLDGQIKKREWLGKNITEHSNIIRNLRSCKQYRQGEWQAQGMVKLVVKIAQLDT